MESLLNQVKITRIKAPTTGSATGDVVADVLDMTGYESVMAVTQFGTANSSNGLKAGMSTASASGGMGDMVGTLVPSLTTGGGVALEIVRPRKRYVQFTAVRQGASKLGDIWAFQFKSRIRPIDNTITDLITSEVHVSPDTGTA